MCTIVGEETLHLQNLRKRLPAAWPRGSGINLAPRLYPLWGAKRGSAGIYEKLLHPGLSEVDYTSPELGCGHDGLDHTLGTGKKLFDRSVI
jgi:hypothetical protein